jgi:hypothetical protein
MGLIQIVFHFISLVIGTYCQAGSAAVDTLESSMRSPLNSVGVDGAMQTFMLALVPVMIMVVTIKLLHGPLRLMVVLGMLGAIFHLTWPLMDDYVAV